MALFTVPPALAIHRSMGAVGQQPSVTASVGLPDRSRSRLALLASAVVRGNQIPSSAGSGYTAYD